MDEKILSSSLKYLDKWLEARYEKIDIPGFAVAVSYKGAILFNQAYGYADLETKEKLTPRHLFRIASHSKTFTATAIMQLQEQGKLNIADPVVNYLPWLKKHRDKRWQKITLRQLLSHGAGVIRDGLDSDYWQLYRPFPDIKRFKQDILEADLVFGPNQKMKYSNYGYNLLGMVVAAVSRQEYRDYVQLNILKALGLKNTYPEYSNLIAGRMATGYSRKVLGDERLPVSNFDSLAETPAAGFCANAEDLCKYFVAHIVGSGKLLSDKSKREMQRRMWKVENVKDKEEYGLGIKIDYEGKRRLIGHDGGFPGFTTKSFCDPKDELAVVVLTNCNGGGAKKIARSIYKFIDYFQGLCKREKDNNINFIGRYAEFFEHVDIVVVGKSMVYVDLDTWEPFEFPLEFHKVSSSTYKFVKGESTMPIGELLHLRFNSPGGEKTITFAGATLLPEKMYLKKISKMKRIRRSI